MAKCGGGKKKGGKKGGKKDLANRYTLGLSS